MKNYIERSTGTIYAYESDGSQDEYIKVGLEPLSDKELAKIQAAKAPTPCELIAALKVSVQQWLDSTANVKGYDSLASCTSYINSGVERWASDASIAIAWRDAVWQECFTLWSAKQDFTDITPPSTSELIAALPQPEIYGWTINKEATNS